MLTVDCYEVAAPGLAVLLGVSKSHLLLAGLVFERGAEIGVLFTGLVLLHLDRRCIVTENEAEWAREASPLPVAIDETDSESAALAELELPAGICMVEVALERLREGVFSTLLPQVSPGAILIFVERITVFHALFDLTQFAR